MPKQHKCISHSSEKCKRNCFWFELVYINHSTEQKIHIISFVEGDNMLKDIAWKMFKQTGNIEYFLQYKEINEKNTDFLTEAASDIALDGEKCRMSKQEEWSFEK